MKTTKARSKLWATLDRDDEDLQWFFNSGESELGARSVQSALEARATGVTGGSDNIDGYTGHQLSAADKYRRIMHRLNRAGIRPSRVLQHYCTIERYQPDMQLCCERLTGVVLLVEEAYRFGSLDSFTTACRRINNAEANEATKTYVGRVLGAAKGLVDGARVAYADAEEPWKSPPAWGLF